MKQLILNQRAFFHTNATKEIAFRITQLKKLERILRENKNRLDEAIHADFQKSAFDNYSNELAIVFHDIKVALQNIKQWSRKKAVRTNLLNFPAKSYIIPEPLGVTLVIGAWNYPYQLSLSPAVAALAAGNTVILKPSELPAETSRVMADIINKNFEPNYFKVVEGGVPETTALLAERFDKIFFTGSAAVGKIVYLAGAKHLTPVTLELGGKSPAIITKNCNLKMAVKRLIWGKFLNAGQTCIAPDYVMVEKAIHDEFVQLAKLEIKKSQFSITNGNYVQIINTHNLERLSKLIDPEKLVHGGKYDLKTRILEPTLMTNISFDHPIMQEEIFGPILPIITYTDLDKAIQQIKCLPKPLACYLFTRSNKTKKKVLKEISFGGGGINETIMHITNPHMPFGGVGESGIGSYHGLSGFQCFSHNKSIIDKPTWFELNLKYYPHTSKKLKIIRQLFKF